MKRVMLLFLALCVASVIGVTGPTSAVAGLRMVAVASPAGDAGVCAASETSRGGFLVVMCRKKAAGGILVCPQMHVILARDGSGPAQRPRGAFGEGLASSFASADGERPLKPPRL